MLAAKIVKKRKMVAQSWSTTRSRPLQWGYHQRSNSTSESVRFTAIFRLKVAKKRDFSKNYLPRKLPKLEKKVPRGHPTSDRNWSIAAIFGTKFDLKSYFLHGSYIVGSQKNLEKFLSLESAFSWSSYLAENSIASERYYLQRSFSTRLNLTLGI